MPEEKNKQSIFLRLAGDWRVCVALIAAIAALVAVEGSWKLSLQQSPVFLVAIFLLLVALGVCCVLAVRGHRNLSFILCHCGTFILFIAALMSAASRQEAVMRVEKGTADYLAWGPSGEAVPLPFKVKLDSFNVDYYDDGVSPRQYTSRLIAEGDTLTTCVNSPCLVRKGWLAYQYNFDRNNPDVSIIQFVRDPWLPLVFLGMLCLALGAVLSFGRIWNSRWMLPAVLALAAIFTCISVAKINFGTLMPALRSLWFVPHLIIYMLAYSMLAISLVCGVLSLFIRKSEQSYGISIRSLGTASSLLILGMLCGAVWAQFAWGNFWAWDPKECWAAATWLLTLAGTHFQGRGRAGRVAFVVIILLAFAAMQITWYGVECLPSAQYSLHTYK